MKTILDKIDPKYLECTTGLCEHSIHQHNVILWCAITVIVLNMVILACKVCKG